MKQTKAFELPASVVVTVSLAGAEVVPTPLEGRCSQAFATVSVLLLKTSSLLTGPHTAR